MKLGIAMNLSNTSPEEWAEKHKALGLSAVVFPCGYYDDHSKIDAYVKACKDFGLTIAEVGAWKNLLALDKEERKQNFDYCKKQLELAEYIGASCCVNISGAKGEVWDGGYKENYSDKTYCEIIETVQRLIDAVNPKKTFYTLEPMPWMHPDSPEDYLKMIKDINRKAFGVHLDIVNMINTPQKYLFNEQFTSDAISLLGGYIKSCHIKDVLLENHLTVSLKEVPCGEGGFNLKNYIEKIDKLDANMPVVIEHLAVEEEYIKAIKYINELKGE
ncbi:MAG: sugar phosphate isomerase/epimerase [Eubacteriales bacterium]|nr:sugar phosphate isomerase/epimerase [Eubacteriales bacterium]MDY2677417.1 sugar phosphate isomerase/epimerase family protein [Oscillospiraceae bacterium]